MSDQEKTVSTDFLFARPSFWSGVGRILDLWGKFDDYNISQTTEEADMRALYSDWRITGQDLRDSWVIYHSEEAANAPQTGTSFVCSKCAKSISHLRGKALKKADSRDHKRWSHVQTPSR